MAGIGDRKASIGWLIRQAQEMVRGEVLRLVKETFEGLLEGLRDEVVGRGRYERGGFRGYYRYGYRVRKSLETSWGTIYGVRIPRVRGASGERGLFGRYERRLWEFSEDLVLGFGQGMSLRSLSVWLRGLGFPTGCPSTLGRVIYGKVMELRERRRRALGRGEYAALVLDGVWLRRRGVRRGKVVLLVATGVRWDGGFEVLDWEGCSGESSLGYERLLDRLYSRGLEEVEVIVGDEACGIWEAVDVVYPYSRRQVCLWHLERTLEGMLSRRDFWSRRRFRRAYWGIFDVDNLDEARGRLDGFLREWGGDEPEVAEALKEREGRIFQYMSLPYWWRDRVRTTNLGESFFRHLRTFVGRFPGIRDEEHANYILATYLLSIQEKLKIGRITPYQPQLNFNTGG